MEKEKGRSPIKQSYQLNPFMRIRFGNPIICDLLLENRSIELPTKEHIKLICSMTSQSGLGFDEVLGKISTVFQVSSEAAQEIFEDLMTNMILVNDPPDLTVMESVQHWVNRGWLDALIFHLRSRNLNFMDNQVVFPDEHNAKILSLQIEKQGLPEFWREYEGKKINLPPPSDLPINKDFQEVLLKRRSHSMWRGKGMSTLEVSDLLHYGNIETKRLRQTAESKWKENPECILNSSFCAIETYFFAFNVDGIEPGLYHYVLKTHELTLIKKGIYRQEISKMCIGQQRPGQGDCALVLSAVWNRYMYRYKHARAYRTLLVNIAELAQKYILLATAFDLSTFLTPALEDQYADELLGVDGYNEAPLYVLSFG